MRLLGGGPAYEAYLAFDEAPSPRSWSRSCVPTRSTTTRTLRGLAREVDMLATVNHPVVVRGLRARARRSTRPHLVLEHIDGPRLSSLIRRYGPLPVQQFLPLASSRLGAALPARGRLVHLDIKPSNIIMGAPRAADRPVGRPAVEPRPRAHARRSAPTPTWRPSSATRRARAPRPASDVWGLGATLFEAAAGYRPFDDGDRDADDCASASRSVAAAPELPDRVPPAVAKPIVACLESTPPAGPLPEEVAEALEPVLARRCRRPRLAGLQGVDSRVEPVAHAAHGLDRVGAELLAQVADVDVDDVGAGVEVVPPHVDEQLLARQHLAGVAQEDLGQCELPGRQVDLAAADRAPAGCAGPGRPPPPRRSTVTSGAAVACRSRSRTRASSSSNRNGFGM